MIAYTVNNFPLTGLEIFVNPQNIADTTPSCHKRSLTPQRGFLFTLRLMLEKKRFFFKRGLRGYSIVGSGLALSAPGIADIHERP